MTQENPSPRFPSIPDISERDAVDQFHREELHLALRNRGMPLEAMRYPITPSGLHYLVIHFDIPDVDADTWRLNVGGLVSNPLSLSLDDIKARPAHTMAVTMECAGNGRSLLNPRVISQPWFTEGIGTAEWTGTPLKGILEEAGLSDEAVNIVFSGADQGIQGDEVQVYQRSLNSEEAKREEMMLVYEMNGQALQPQHGYPLRLLLPGWYGMASVKWLDTVEAIGEVFQGFQMTTSYRYTQVKGERGEPVTLIRVRALMAPPGIPDTATRGRLVTAGTHLLTGRAWAGRLGISRVEVSVDGGSGWSDATLGEQASSFAWRPWSFEWNADPGWHTLSVRATDTDENVQPLEQFWNAQGMGNNMAQQVRVLVE
jgi:DMSO/TMAO reductase YedYZ molybdopterin-dependent catalytic subunit